ncbi:MAG: hypothetical protein ACN4GR_02040 [Arenicellales bacterium]
MVVGEKFAWAHIPKTGGDSTHLLFREVDDGSLQFIDGPEKHNSFRQEEIAGLNRISNIRRLPSLLKSWAVHYSQHSKWNPGNEDRPYSRKQLLQGLVWWLEPYTSDWRLVKIDQVIFDYYELDSVYQWIRTETLLADFRQVMSEYVDVSQLDDGFVSNQGSYQRKMQFSRSELRQIYNSCGRWAELEEKVYGDVLSSDAHYKEYVADHRALSLISRQLRRVFY